MDIAIQVAFISLVGTLIVALYTARQERDRQRLEAELSYVRSQIEELYGPLYGLTQRSKSIFDISLAVLPAVNGRQDRGVWSKQDWDVWEYILENYLLENRLKMAELITSKTHLIEGKGLPPSFREFLAHEAQATCLFKLWREKQVSMSAGESGVGYPKSFNNEVEQELETLHSRYEMLLARRRKA